MTLPVVYSAPLDRTRVRNFGVGLVATVNLFSRAPAPTSYLLRSVTGGYQPEERLGAPDQSTDQGPNWSLGQPVEINLTFSPLISHYDLNLTYFILFTFHHRSEHRACLIVTVSWH